MLKTCHDDLNSCIEMLEREHQTTELSIFKKIKNQAKQIIKKDK
ncbi:hypothetical protein L289_1247 [Acinetobacter gerneri DSM 14967 = CIP 107464 = MTCC 9824]|nr:hypothetical protein L289_1247 [Acinetobacter gerneri DSM 14967 = CIP 107464 = MTCC 9824]